MKPNWKDAPEWAQWLAMDEGGDWWWYESKPLKADVCWLSEGIHRPAMTKDENWDKTSEQRPEVQP